MHKLMCGVFAVLMLAACGGTGPGGSGTPVITLPTAAADAMTQLCGATGDASLSGLASKLDAFDPTTMDTSEFQVQAGAVASNLAQLNLSGDQATLRDAAVSAIQSVQGTTVDKATVTQAAVALRSLETAVC